jgi:hypothetical protein
MVTRLNLLLVLSVLIFIACGDRCEAGTQRKTNAAVVDAAARSQTTLNAPLNPWSDLKIDADAIVMTDKRLVLSSDGLPKQISIGDHNLLNKPISFEVANNVFTATENAQQPQWIVSTSKDHATSTNELTVMVGGRSLRLTLHREVWFDGLMTFQLSSQQFPQSFQDAPIRYRIPLADGMATFMHRWAPVGKRNVALDTLGGELSFGYVPFIWLGDDDRGLFWLSESSLGWKNSNSQDAIKLLRDGKSWVLEINIRPQVQQDGSWHHSFGLMPTPVKALPKNWRSMRMVPAAGGSAYVMWPNDKEIGASYFGYPASHKQSQFSRILVDLKHSGVTALPYVCPTWIATKAPEWQQHGREWRSGVADRTFSDEEGGAFVNVCPARNSWKEFVRTRFGAFIKQNQLTGIYMDNAQVYATADCLNVDAGPGYLEYPMLDQRDSYSSVVRSLRENSAQTFAVVHSSGGLNLPSFSVVDAWVSGEQYRDVVRNDYLDVASLTDFRVELNAVHWGLVPFFLPEFPEEQAREVSPTRKLMSILLLHDVTPWPQWANVVEVNRGLAMLDKFDVRDAVFVPYYSPQPLAKAQAAGVYVSGYRRGNRKLLIASNLTKTAAVTQICLASDTTSTSRALHTWPELKAMPLQGSCTSVEIPAGAYQMYCADCARVGG